MYISGHPALLYLLIVYSIIFLFKTKSKNEFLIILTIFIFFIEKNSWENGIVSLTVSPIRTQPSDIALLILVFYIIKSRFNNVRVLPLAFNSKIISIFILFIFLFTYIGYFQFGYAAIAEFRSIYFFIIFLMFLSSNIHKDEIPNLIKTISSYLIPIILLAPINLLLTLDFNFSIANRQFGALMYESIVLGFIAGYLYYLYVDKEYKIVHKFLPVLIIMIPYTSHRTTWALVFAILPILFFWQRNTKYFLTLLIIGIVSSIFIQVDTLFFEERLTAFTDFNTDASGSWRLLIWNAVIDEATLLGKGIGARFIVYAPVIGFKAMAGAHNGFIQTLYYLGYVGMFSLVGLIVFFLVSSFKKYRAVGNENTNKLIHRLSFLATIGLIMYMMGYGADVISWIFISFSLLLPKKTKIII
ncbi:MAG: O-antigen ligase domain-containing protein [Calditrichaeota bacterium]|nr:MAG: O-antigen ligase domain-containing protein [Calditrichota bacterium]MBL1204600.1 O-antigen ligase domain-containing protein [Calditrichota bacterium]NOG44429.1 O-antigen ligase family protein [Calditrichota bacterium]